MTDKQIIIVAKGFTKGLLGNTASLNMCFDVCYPLSGYLNFAGIPCELTKGEILYDGGKWHHYWITLSDGRIIDPTADQFVKPGGERLQNIWVENKPENYRVIKIKKGLYKQTPRV